MNRRKLLAKALASPNSLRFEEAVALVEALGFRLARVSGSHHIFVHSDLQELVNLQSVHGNAKPYQVGQVLRLIERYNLRLRDEE